ncbi:MAG: hypothetical protein HY966_07555, partial [Ignavibacteriales bacterium]|nr:hypothetical protein [Ignavibacteriales bacterium]
MVRLFCCAAGAVRRYVYRVGNRDLTIEESGSLTIAAKESASPFDITSIAMEKKVNGYLLTLHS